MDLEEGGQIMFNHLKEETIIKHDWHIWFDGNGNLRCNGIVFQVFDAKDYSNEEKAVLLSDRKAEYLARMQDSWKEKQAVLGDMDTDRAAKQWDYEYNIRMKYLPLIIPDWILSSEDITLLAADICSPLFVENIKKYDRQEKYSRLGYDAFLLIPRRESDSLTSNRIHISISADIIISNLTHILQHLWNVLFHKNGEYGIIPAERSSHGKNLRITVK